MDGKLIRDIETGLGQYVHQGYRDSTMDGKLIRVIWTSLGQHIHHGYRDSIMMDGKPIRNVKIGL